LRFTNPAEDRQVSSFQTEALRHLNATSPDLPTPRLVLSEDDSAEVEVVLVDGRRSITRVITLLPGIPLARVPERNPALRLAMADTLARMDLAFTSFSHPASSHELLWDMKHALSLRKLLVYQQDAETRALIEREDNVVPVQTALRAQVIHNDFNFSNVMVDKHRSEITGVLDFGDMVHAPLIYDLAVALAYQFSGDDDEALAIINAFTLRYHRVFPLEIQELELLYDLIAARQILSLLITQWRASLYPENSQYILRNNAISRVGIQRLSALDRGEVTHMLVGSCFE
jgi:Ser/Thr protein kinase RdoA (MazF antagonist)